MFATDRGERKSGRESEKDSTSHTIWLMPSICIYAQICVWMCFVSEWEHSQNHFMIWQTLRLHSFMYFMDENGDFTLLLIVYICCIYIYMTIVRKCVWVSWKLHSRDFSVLYNTWYITIDGFLIETTKNYICFVWLKLAQINFINCINKNFTMSIFSQFNRLNGV